MPEKLVTENNLSERPWNIFNTDESGIQANNKTESVITEKGSSNVHVLTSGEKSENVRATACCNVRATACCNAAHQLPLLVLIFKDIYKKEDFGDGLPPRSDVYMNHNLMYFSTHLFIKRFTEYFLKPKIQGRWSYFYIVTEFIAFPLYSFRLLLKIMLLSFVCLVTVLIFYSR
jgi:hypothetical protein